MAKPAGKRASTTIEGGREEYAGIQAFYKKLFPRPAPDRDPGANAAIQCSASRSPWDCTALRSGVPNGEGPGCTAASQSPLTCILSVDYSVG